MPAWMKSIGVIAFIGSWTWLLIKMASDTPSDPVGVIALAIIGFFVLIPVMEFASTGITGRLLHPITWIVKTLVTNRLVIGIFAASVLLISGVFGYEKSIEPRTVSDCLLRYLPSANNEYIAQQMRAACNRKYPD